MNIYAEIRRLIIDSLVTLAADGVLPAGLVHDAITVGPPREEAHGELATNAALVLAKPTKRKPREIAELLATRLLEAPTIRSAEVAGAGFVNLRLEPSFWYEAVRTALREGTGYGQSRAGSGTRVNVEFVSANPTGPLHIGHARGAVYGDALASLLTFGGYQVAREYYVNDGGAQVEALARSAHLRYREALGEAVELPGTGVYPGEYLIPVGEALVGEYGDRYKGAGESEWLELFRDFAVTAMMGEIRADLAGLGVIMDDYVSERELQASGKVEKTIEVLAARGLVYEGVLEPPKGAPAEDWEAREQTLFRSSAYGDDRDRPLRRADGQWAYFAPDLTYHGDKLARGFEILIDVWGEDHGGYVQRMKAAVAALSDGKVPFDIRLCRLVRLLQDGKPFKMSKREGTFVLMRDIIAEVGRDAMRFALLMRKNDAVLDFDIKRVLDQSRDNPVFYVHYAHARACSVLRKAEATFAGVDFGNAALAAVDMRRLENPATLALVRRIAAWPEMVQTAVEVREPHHISFYLQDLAAELHALWTAGRADDALRLVQEDDVEASRTYLALISAAAVVIRTGLGILGIEARQEMR